MASSADLMIRKPTLLQGSLSARGERILFLDADGATEITDLARLEKVLGELASDHVKSWLCVCV